MIVEFYVGTSSPQSVIVKNGSNVAITGSPYTSTLVANGRHQITIDNANVTDGATYYLSVSGLCDWIFKADESGARVYAREWIDPAVDLDAVLEAIDAIQPALTGPYELDVSVEDDNGDPVSSAKVRVTNGSTWETKVGTGTDSILFALSDDTWTVTVAKNGYSSAVESITIDGAGQSLAVVLTRTVFPPSGTPGLCTVGFEILKPDGTPIPGAKVVARFKQRDTVTSASLIGDSVTSAVTDDDGITSLELIKSIEVISGSAEYEIIVYDVTGKNVISRISTEIPNQDTVDYADLVAQANA
jgi:hypothetical protein